jgi:FixJ family two-component response regulator
VTVPRERSITIVEDDDSVRAALVGLVTSLGYSARDFSSAEELLAGRDRGLGDCIITDIQMPGLSGIEMARRLRAGGDSVPVIMITARDDPGLEAKALASGALCLLKKPFGTGDMAEWLERALTSARSQKDQSR